MNYITYLYEKRNIKPKLLQYLEESCQILSLLMPTHHNSLNQLLYSKNYLLEDKISENNESEDVLINNEINECNINNIVHNILYRMLLYEKLGMNNIKLGISLEHSSDKENIKIDNDFIWNIYMGYENNIVGDLLSYIKEKTKCKSLISNAKTLEELELELENENDNSYMDNKIKSYIDFYFVKINTLNEKIKKRVNREIQKYRDTNNVELEMNDKHPLFITGTEYLSFCLFTLNNIKLLGISWCGIEDEGFKFICLCFNKINNLEELHSCCNKITDVGIGYFCDNCENIPNLTLLDLRCNIISIDGCNIISDNIAKCPKLCNLWLDRDIFNNNQLIISNIKNKHPNKDLNVTLSNVFTGFI